MGLAQPTKHSVAWLEAPNERCIALPSSLKKTATSGQKMQGRGGRKRPGGRTLRRGHSESRKRAPACGSEGGKERRYGGVQRSGCAASAGYPGTIERTVPIFNNVIEFNLDSIHVAY
jgi:hypothetical protein